jgi:hypothetical protein
MKPEGEDAKQGRGPRSRRARLRALGLSAGPLLALALAVPAAQGALGALTDLLALGHAGGQKPVKAEVQQNREPALKPTPQVRCDGDSKPEPGIQGRVPEGAAADGLWCNARLLGHDGSSGGFKVHRYVDEAGRECAYYDTALLFPANALQLSRASLGVIALDMSDPANPEETDRLTELPMLTPHESLEVNQRRGLIAAVAGNPVTLVGLVSIYDASEDCRDPVLRSTTPVARFGHESGFSRDGKTFYAAGTAVQAITAIDVTDTAVPRPIWHGSISSHGLSLSPDGERAYLADAVNGQLVILDTSQIQDREPSPRAREVSRLTWKSASIPQNAIPFSKKGKQYVLEIDEYGNSLRGSEHDIGAGRIIDVSRETKPRVISNLRLEVNQPDEHRAAGSDPGASQPVQGYAGHYCDVSSAKNPKIAACSFIVSGLRIFDISNLKRPKEIAYFVAPTESRFENGFQASSYAMSRPAIVPRRREVWYSDGTSGFYSVKVDKRVWPR